MVDSRAFVTEARATLRYLATAELTKEEWREVRERLARLDQALESLRGTSDPEAAGKLLEEAEEARSGIESLSYRMSGKPALAGLDPKDELNILIGELDGKLLLTETRQFLAETRKTLDHLKTLQLEEHEWKAVRKHLERLEKALEALRTSEAADSREILEQAEELRAWLDRPYEVALMAGKPEVRGLDPQDELNILIDEITTKVVEVGRASEAAPTG